MARKLETISLSGKEYAQVATRIKEFRTMCPKGLISTTYDKLDDGNYIFKTLILKDKSDENSGEGTGHAMGKLTGAKAFEKLETISVGRALAMIGFMASGEVASFDEMEDFLSDKEMKKQTQIQELMEKVDAIEDVVVLREFYATHRGLGIDFDKYVAARGKALKAKATPDEKETKDPK